MKVLVVSHAHPELSIGGGEAAAYAQFKELKNRSGTESKFLAVDTRSRLAGWNSTIVPFGAGNDEFLAYPGELDPFFIINYDTQWLTRDFSRMLLDFRPDVVHFHHYFRVGVEAFRAVKKILPSATVILTLHEFLALCHNHGQMVKTDKDQSLCTISLPTDCARCFVNTPASEFALRRHTLLSHFQSIDGFIAPSDFLKNRYAQWGLAREKIRVIDNGQPAASPAGIVTPSVRSVRNRFGFFGKASQLKGIEVVAAAVDHFNAESTPPFELHFFGGNLENESAEVRARFHAFLERFPTAVKFHGRYAADDLHRLMEQIDWVLAPSIWWENSPLVIQEAFRFRKPVICSDIGGMAEKVSHEKNGLHFRARDSRDLARTLKRCLTESALWDQLESGIAPPFTIAQAVDQQLAWYAAIRSQPASASRA